MPHAEPVPIAPPSLVAVTGANGFIASHTIDALLSQGFRVLGTVRSASKAKLVQKTHAASLNSHLLSTAIIPDILSADAYISLFTSTNPVAILHLASPFAYTAIDFEHELLKPAVKGTEALLQAATQCPSIRRIIHTNSFACIYDAALGPRPGYTYTSADFSPLTYTDGTTTPSVATAYRASKAVAETTALSFMHTHPNSTFDLISLCPAMVFGPFLSPASTPSSIAQLNTSNQLIWDIISAGSTSPMPPTKGPVWVDVRDVAAAHLTALTRPELGGRRLLLAAGVYCAQEIADVARASCAKRVPQRTYSERIPVGEAGRRESESHFGVDASADAAALGIEWRGLGECLAELVPQLFGIEEAQRE